ncbi:hypothetical protein [Proteiniphilum sp. X52]|nr:hypothetical protein [Proteiniphilum sp. X52]
MDKLNSTSLKYKEFQRILHLKENNTIAKAQFIMDQAKQELK